MGKADISIKDLEKKVHYALSERAEFIYTNPMREIDDEFDNYCMGAINGLRDAQTIIRKIVKEMIGEQE